jgi:hypothetical protein
MWLQLVLVLVRVVLLLSSSCFALSFTLPACLLYFRLLASPRLHYCTIVRVCAYYVRACWGWDSRSTAWKRQMAALNIIVDVAKAFPDSLEHELRRSIDVVMDCSGNSKKQVADAAAECLHALTDVVTNPEAQQLRPFIIAAILDNAKMQDCVDAIMEKTFVNSLTIPALSLIFPALFRAMRSSKAALVQKACTAITNVTALVKDLEDLMPFRHALIEEVSKHTKHSWPEVREAAEKAVAVIHGIVAQTMVRNSD